MRIASRSRWSMSLAALLAAVLAVPSAAVAHPRVSPAVSLSGKLQLYSLVVPTEKSGVSTTKVVLTVPGGFSIDSFVPPPAGWTQQVQQTGSGEKAIIQRVTWSGGHTPAGEDSLFQFLAQPSSTGTYSFQVQQTYSDGSVVDWSGGETSDSPAPSIQVAGSLGGGGTSTLTFLALILGTLGLLAGGYALSTRGGGKRDLV